MTNVSGKAELDGETVTFPELAERTGLRQETLYARWRNGDRGAVLIRPLRVKVERDPDAPPPKTNEGNEASKEARSFKRDKERAENERRLHIRLSREKRRNDIIAAHRQAFSEPLIAADLLSAQERDAIYARVKGAQRLVEVPEGE